MQHEYVIAKTSLPHSRSTCPKLPDLLSSGRRPKTVHESGSAWLAYFATARSGLPGPNSTSSLSMRRIVQDYDNHDNLALGE
jgi:hypothetical protein